MDPQLDCLGCKKTGKCCDFQPFIPNYLLGAILAAGNELPSAGEHHYQPLGLIPGRSFRERHAQNEVHGTDLFCQFFINGKCSIYKFRPSECRNYFCEGMTNVHHLRSRREFDFETRLAQLALRHLGFSDSFISNQIDILNIEAEPEAGDGIPLELYRSAFVWAGQKPASGVEVRSWI
jgi:Fe-S-cluster containining protein